MIIVVATSLPIDTATSLPIDPTVRTRRDQVAINTPLGRPA
jgi:hypothetical protein